MPLRVAASHCEAALSLELIYNYSMFQSSSSSCSRRVLALYMAVLFMIFSYQTAFAQNPNPIVVWNFNEGSGFYTEAKVIVGTTTYMATGTVSSSYSAWERNGGGYALEFHGLSGEGAVLSDDSFGYIVPDSTKFASLNFNLRLDSIGKDQVVFAADVRDTSGKYEVVHISPTGQIVVSWKNGYSSTLTEVASTETLATGVWHYISIVRGMGRVAIMVDGKNLTLTGDTSNFAWFNEFLGANVSYHVGTAKNRDFPGVLSGAIDDLSYPFNPTSAVSPVLITTTTQNPLPSITLTAVKTSQASANVASVNWSTKNADYCEANGDWKNGNIGIRGTHYYTMPSLTATFSITCFSAYGRNSATTSLTIDPPPVRVARPTTTPPAALSPKSPPVAPPPTLEMMLAAAPRPTASTDPVRLGEIKYATENSSGLLYLKWTTNIAATSRLFFRTEGDSAMIDAQVNPVPDVDHDARISVKPGKLVIARISASDQDGRSSDAKEYRFIAPGTFSNRNIYTIGGIAVAIETLMVIPESEITAAVSDKALETDNPATSNQGTVPIQITATKSEVSEASRVSMSSILMLLAFLAILGVLLFVQYRRREFPFAKKIGEGDTRDNSN